MEIGGIPVRLLTREPVLLAIAEERYADYLQPGATPCFELELELLSQNALDPESDVEVAYRSGRWRLQRGDFLAEWDPRTRQGRVRQPASPYALDSVLRILHTLALAERGGFLLHAASAIIHGEAVLFAGRSGAGKTTISRLAPPSVTLLTDEISYVARTPQGHIAYGTPFSGELAAPGANVCAPIATLYLLAQGPENLVQEVEEREAVQAILQNILFFAREPKLVQKVFAAACEFVRSVAVRRLTFVPDASVWEKVA